MDGAYNFSVAQALLKLTATRYGGSGFDTLLFSNYSEIGSPTHQQVPFGFKLYAVDKAASLGYETILWCDSFVAVLRSLEPMFRFIEQTGCFFMAWGQNCSAFIGDHCLEKLRVTREKARTICGCVTTSFGLDLRRPSSRKFISRMHAATDVGAFLGNGNNLDLSASLDPDCKGHRHDQSVASIVVNQLGLPTTEQPHFLHFSTHYHLHRRPEHLVDVLAETCLLRYYSLEICEAALCD